MRTVHRKAGVLAAAVLATLATTGVAAAAQPEGSVVPARQHYGDQYIVVLKDASRDPGVARRAVRR